MLAWYICYWWCLYCLQDASDRWRQLWRDKHCGTTIPKSIFSLLNHKCCGTNLQLRSKRKTTWKRSFGCKQYWEPQKRAGNEGSFREKGVFLEYFWGNRSCFLKMCGSCTNNFQEVKLWSEKGRQKRTARICYPVLCILWVLSSLNSQTSSSYLMKKIIQQFCRWLLVRALLHNQHQNMLNWVVELTSNMHDCISSNTRAELN